MIDYWREGCFDPVIDPGVFLGEKVTIDPGRILGKLAHFFLNRKPTCAVVKTWLMFG